MALIDRVKNIILNNRYLSLATQGSDGVWISPLAYTILDNDLIFYSSINSLHCTNIMKNPKASIAVFDSSLPSDKVDGLQAEVTVELISDDELSLIVPDYYKNSFPDIEIRKKREKSYLSFCEGNKQRFYRIQFLNLYLIDLDSIDEDKRIMVNLEDLVL